MPRISPALEDGRAFTTYLSSGLLNRKLMARLGAANETQYRRMLQARPDVAKSLETLPAAAPWMRR